MRLFLNVSYYDMLLFAKLKNIIENIKYLRKIYYSFIIILILQHYFRLGERQLWDSLNTPEILNDLNDRIHEYMYTYTPRGVCL